MRGYIHPSEGEKAEDGKMGVALRGLKGGGRGNRGGKGRVHCEECKKCKKCRLGGSPLLLSPVLSL